MTLFVLTFECVDDMEVYPVIPQAYTNEEKAIQALYNAYESASAEYPEDYERIKSKYECDIYEEGRYSENRWVGRIDKIEVDE
jgi:hypothetical protein